MALQFSYDKSKAGNMYRLAGGILYELGTDNRFRGTSAARSDGDGTYADVEYVQLSGAYTVSQMGNTMWQTYKPSNRWIDLKDGWVEYDHSGVPTISEAKAQEIINGMIKNNIHITENNLFCARYADKLTSDQRKQIAQLQKRVMDRQDALRNDGLVYDIQESYPRGYADLEPYLAKLMKSEGIGIVWWAACIIAALVVGGLAAASYFIYRDLFEESKEDVKWSDELTAKLLEKLTPEEFEQLKNETAGIVTKARIRAKLGSWGTILKVAAILVAGAFAYKFFTNKQQ